MVLFGILSLKICENLFSYCISTYVVASVLLLVWKAKNIYPLAIYSKMFSYPWLGTLYLSLPPLPPPQGNSSAEFCLLSSELKHSSLSSRFYPSFIEPSILNPLCSMVMVGPRERDRCDGEFSTSFSPFTFLPLLEWQFGDFLV